MLLIVYRCCLGKWKKLRSLRRPKGVTLNVRCRDSRIRFKEAHKKKIAAGRNEVRGLIRNESCRDPRQRRFQRRLSVGITVLYSTCSQLAARMDPLLYRLVPRRKVPVKQGHSHLSIRIKELHKNEGEQGDLLWFYSTGWDCEVMSSGFDKNKPCNYLPGTCFAYIHSWSGKVLS